MHARWLVQDGYAVDLIDPVARHVEQAAEVCGAALGDARSLSPRDDSYDVAVAGHAHVRAGGRHSAVDSPGDIRVRRLLIS